MKKQAQNLTQKKKLEIAGLKSQLENAQVEETTLQTVVDALTKRSIAVNDKLAVFNTRNAIATQNKNLVDQILLQLNYNDKNGVAQAKTKTLTLLNELHQLIAQVIYAAELVNKLSNIIVRKKAFNPLISDDLIAMLSRASIDANTSVALLLKALQGGLKAQTSILQIDGVISCVKQEAASKNLTARIFDEAALSGHANYKEMLSASKMVNNQLSTAQSMLNEKQVMVNSYGAGLKAAERVGEIG